MSIMVGGKDSKLNISFHGNIRIPSPLPSGLTRSHECRQKVGDSVGVLIAVRNVLNTEAHKIEFPDRSLIQFPWGMHICYYDKEKKEKNKGGKSSGPKSLLWLPSASQRTTQVGSHVCKKESCLCGVSQGSDLAPLLFLFYINYIYNSFDKLSLYLFADDTSLL